MSDATNTVNTVTPTGQASGSSWSKKAINVSLTLGKGTFGGSGFNTVNLKGLRIIATVTKGGAPSADSANVRIYGVTPSIMNEVSTLGSNPTGVRQNNNVTIEAGDEGGAMAIVYRGAILNCYQDYDESPETALVIDGLGPLLINLKPQPPLSYAGASDVATVMSTIAARAGVPFENNGVQVTMNNIYLWGTDGQQANKLKEDAGIQMQFDMAGTGKENGILAIWPSNGSRTGAIPLINVASGLVGYPKFRDKAMSFRCLFDASRNIRIGGKIKMESKVGASADELRSQKPAENIGGPNGVWRVTGPIVHTLASQIPGGPWFTDVTVSSRFNEQRGTR